MKLKSVKYSQFDGQEYEWNLDPLTLNTLNLIVGKNASGKTKTLNLINNLAKLLRGEIKPNFASANWEACFENIHQNYKYILRIDNGVVVKETLEINGLVRLTRGKNGIGKIYAEKLNKEIDFQTPDSELALTARRDNIQHPYFEPLYEWASSVYYYAFGSSLGKLHFVVNRKEGESEIDPKNADLVVGIYKKGYEQFGQKFKDAIKQDLKNIGYVLSDLGIGTISNLSLLKQVDSSLTGLWVQESDLKGKTEQLEISQGMFRALSLIIQLNFSAMAHKPSCIILDDIGEGLDYERACALIKLLITKTKQSKVQLIMATNDRFVMNSVPIEHWTVLYRDGARCKVFNIHNSREKFEEFKFTGLNNFDFFSMDYLTTDNKK